MRRKLIYYLSGAGMEKLRASRAFSVLSKDQQDYVEEFLFTSLGGHNRVGASVLRSRIDRMSDLLGSGENEPLKKAVRLVIDVEEAGAKCRT